ncbi:acyltransferase family protein [Seleniivibrio sp.]|uniref:acyltransferase family protein n=1 Tax=Seleniivibrio sp. TaxID=2898801 RepID=UPI002600BD83|nr:acyltransferase family protein [Seleniivibrio sp.]MCD8552853.1 acyltransferase [Seleniivibrio sp.]
MQYRKDVDGLRAVAVLPVILYHAGISAFSGGYVGVDIFFVISGYLITGIISAEMSEGTFTVSNFYVRRIKRIFPALYFMMLVTIILSGFLLLPEHFRNFGKSVAATVFFSSNFFFWKQSGYFDAAAETKPLLHTWSLGVEEQFYIIFPLFLLWLYKKRHNIKLAVAAVFVCSLALSIFLTYRKPEMSFYLLPTRAWELMLGTMLSLGVFRRAESRALNDILSVAGIAMIAFSVALFNAATPFPGYSALLPCTGAALLIYAGEKSIMGRILSFRPLVFIGLLSYALYLWHWTFIAFRNYYSNITGDAFFMSNWFIIAVTFLFAVLSYYFVEHPIRRRKFPVPSKLFKASAAVMLLFTAIGTVIYKTDGMPFRMPESVSVVTDAPGSTYRNTDCYYRDPMKAKIDNLCRMGDKKGKPTFIVWGDSHALSLTDGMNKFAAENGTTGVFAGKSSCPPLRLVRILINDVPTNCRQFNDIIYKEVAADNDIKNVFLVGRWEVYSGKPTLGNDAGSEMRLDDGITKDVIENNNLKVFEEGLVRTVGSLERAGKNVYFVMDVPEVPYDVPSEMGKIEYFRRVFPALTSFVNSGLPYSHYQQRNENVFKVLEKVKQKTNVKVVNVQDVLCRNGECRLTEGGKSLYADDDHLSVFGSEYVVGSSKTILDAMLK